METGKSKEKRGGAKSGRRRRRKMVIQDLCWRPQGAGVAKGTICPSMDGVVSFTEARQAMSPQGSSWARTPCWWLLLLSPAECGALLKLQLPRLSCQPAP